MCKFIITSEGNKFGYKIIELPFVNAVLNFWRIEGDAIHFRVFIKCRDSFPYYEIESYLAN